MVLRILSLNGSSIASYNFTIDSPYNYHWWNPNILSNYIFRIQSTRINIFDQSSTHNAKIVKITIEVDGIGTQGWEGSNKYHQAFILIRFSSKSSVPATLCSTTLQIYNDEQRICNNIDSTKCWVILETPKI